MKNRPVAAQPNQFKDVYGSQKSSTRATITVLLLIVMTVLTIIAWVNRSYVLLALFAPFALWRRNRLAGATAAR